MAALNLTARALDDLERLVEFLLDSDSVAATETERLIMEALDILRRHPLIGRPVESGLRELVISRGASGYLALYSVEESDDAIMVLAIRHQREVGFADDQGGQP